MRHWPIIVLSLTLAAPALAQVPETWREWPPDVFEKIKPVGSRKSAPVRRDQGRGSAPTTRETPFEVNIALNPSFEEGLPQRQQVHDWLPAPWFPDAQYSWDADVKRTGKRSLRVGGSAKPDGTATMGGWTGSVYTAFPGLRYTLAGWVCASAPEGRTHLILAWYDRHKRFLCNTDNGFVVHGPSEWLRGSTSDFPPEDAAFVRAYFRSDGNPGSAWVDDVELALSAEVAGQLAVPNGSFEAGAGATAAAWSAEARFSLVTGKDKPHAGEQCVALQDQPGQAALVSLPFALDGTHVAAYRFSAWVNTRQMRSGSVQLAIRWTGRAGDVTETAGDSVSPDESGWAEKTLEVEVPRAAELRQGQLVLRGMDVTGTVLFDDVSLSVRLADPIPAPKGPLGVAIARCYAEHLVPPHRLRGHFETMLPRQEDAKRVLGEVESYCQTHPETMDNETKWTLGVLRYHAGQYQAAVDALFPLRHAYATTNMRNDLIWHYAHWAHSELVEAEATERRKRLAQQARVLPSLAPDARLRETLALADDYRFLEGWDEAARLYGDALAFAPTTTPPRMQFHRAECLYRAGKVREALQGLRSFVGLKETSGLQERARRLMGDCYADLPPGDLAAADFGQHLQVQALPGAVFAGDDTRTGPHWRGRYGGYAWVLCAMISPVDIVGGLCEPVRYDGGTGEEIPGWSLSRGAKSRLRYAVRTTDPAEPGRGHLNKRPDAETLREVLHHPVSGEPVSSSWDDRGETHPYDSNGPDLCVELAVPAGTYRLALYMQGHEVRLMSAGGTVLAQAPRVDFGGKRHGYRRFVVFGPLDVTVQIVKGESECAKLRALFLDRLGGPRLPPEALTAALPAPAVLSPPAADKTFGELVGLWQTDRRGYRAELERWGDVTAQLQDSVVAGQQAGPAVRTYWMLWQAHAERGEADKAAAALSAMADGLADNAGTDRALARLDVFAETYLLEHDVLAAEALQTEGVRLALAASDGRTAVDRVAGSVERFWTVDALYAQAVAVKVVDHVAGWQDQEAALRTLREIGQRWFRASAGPPARYALETARRLGGQGCLAAEDQLRLAQTYEPPWGWFDAIEPDPAVREYLVLMRNYRAFTGQAEAGLRLVKLLMSKSQAGATAEVLAVLKRDCSDSPATREAEQIVSALGASAPADAGGNHGAD